MRMSDQEPCGVVGSLNARDRGSPRTGRGQLVAAIPSARSAGDKRVPPRSPGLEATRLAAYQKAKWVAGFGGGWYLLRMRRAATVFACVGLLGSTALSLRAGDWPQWAGSDAKNMVSA